MWHEIERCGCARTSCICAATAAFSNDGTNCSSSDTSRPAAACVHAGKRDAQTSNPVYAAAAANPAATSGAGGNPDSAAPACDHQCGATAQFDHDLQRSRGRVVRQRFQRSQRAGTSDEQSSYSQFGPIGPGKIDHPAWWSGRQGISHRQCRIHDWPLGCGWRHFPGYRFGPG